MDKSWKEIFKNYPKREKLSITIDEINNKRKTTTIYPPEKLVFRVFDLPLKDIKVVILGQDPYHNPGQACGLSL